MKVEGVIKKGIAKIRRLDIEEQKFLRRADGILQSSAVGQAPPVYHETLDHARDVQASKAAIWNSIRSQLVNGKTLWQRAINGGHVFKLWGPESHLQLSADDIESILNL